MGIPEYGNKTRDQLKADFEIEYQKVLENEAQARAAFKAKRRGRTRTEHQRAAERRRKQARKLVQWRLWMRIHDATCDCDRVNRFAWKIGHHAGRLFAMREEQYDRKTFYQVDGSDPTKAWNNPRIHKYHPSQLMRKWTGNQGIGSTRTISKT